MTTTIDTELTNEWQRFVDKFQLKEGRNVYDVNFRNVLLNINETEKSYLFYSLKGVNEEIISKDDAIELMQPLITDPQMFYEQCERIKSIVINYIENSNKLTP